MNGAEDNEATGWIEVLAKSAAMLALQGAKLEADATLERASFLEGLGISSVDVAQMLGIQASSLSKAKLRARKGGRRAKGQNKD